MGALFNEFAMHYGSARMAAHWKGLDPEQMKVKWAKRLLHMPRRNIGYALRYLPQNPPTVDEFVSIANRCPPPVIRSLPHCLSTEQRDAGRERLAKLRAQFFTRQAEGA